ncbi:MAG TPA: PD-(D/E)XK nuclease family protein [Thermoanaerobaculia bacterium]|nr:PD-(D/E)XK nuclease family protein [Thermoanaerobaculia bacterium]
MKIVFDPDFDGGAWPGPLEGRTASAGEAWVGEAGLLGLLETSLGLAGPPIPSSRRVAALVPAVRSSEGFWSASASIDPLAVSRRLLGWRDFLFFQGWRGEEIPGAPRLTALAAVTHDALPGSVDRLLAVESALAVHSAEVAELSFLAEPYSFPTAWRRLFDALARQGTRTAAMPLAPAPASGDLSAARGSGFVPTGDGSLQLVHPVGPLEAAESVAAWLAAQDSLDGTVVISPEPVLDAALRRHGLPTTGAAATVADDALLPVVPLTLALGLDPADPQQALDLLLLPIGPVPKSVAGALADALHDQPAVGSPKWTAALERALDHIEDESRRKALSDRLEQLFRPGAFRDPDSYPAEEARRRLAVLERWLRGRIERDDDPAPFERALSFCLDTADILDRSGLTELTKSQLERVVAEASAALPASAPFPREAGLGVVGLPGGIGGPARRIVWWNFQRADTSGSGSFPATPAERAALAAVGIEIEASGVESVRRALRWRRPLLYAGESLVLVAPHRDAAGDELHPHSLWDEITASLAPGARPGLLERPAPFGPRTPVSSVRALRPIPEPRVDWNGPAVPLREVESPSSLEKLIGCSLLHALTYAGGLWPGRSGTLPDGALLLGSVCHSILERVLARAGFTPDEAAEEAERLFDTTGPFLGASLFLPGAERDRAVARRAVRDAARHLVGLAARLGVSKVEVERALEAPWPGGTVRGRADLVLTSPSGVVDLKWSKGIRRDLLRNGGALQLAAYARLLAHEDGLRDLPPVAYYILRDAVLLAQSGSDFPGAEAVGGPPPRDVWAAVEPAALAARERLARGELGSPGIEQNTEAAAALTDEGLFVPAPCRYCDCGALCGRDFPAEGA